MTREEALAVLKTNYRCMTEEKNCPRTCEGCGLSMQPGELEEATRVAIKTLEPKRGHWEQYGDPWEDKFKCSECGKEQPKILCCERIIGHWSDYCPNCGAMMEDKE